MKSMFSSEKFVWVGDVGVAKESELGDIDDYTLSVVSNVSGETVHFYPRAREYGSEGQLLYTTWAGQASGRRDVRLHVVAEGGAA